MFFIIDSISQPLLFSRNSPDIRLIAYHQFFISVCPQITTSFRPFPERPSSGRSKENQNRRNPQRGSHLLPRLPCKTFRFLFLFIRYRFFVLALIPCQEMKKTLPQAFSALFPIRRRRHFNRHPSDTGIIDFHPGMRIGIRYFNGHDRLRSEQRTAVVIFFIPRFFQKCAVFGNINGIDSIPFDISCRNPQISEYQRCRARKMRTIPSPVLRKKIVDKIFSVRRHARPKRIWNRFLIICGQSVRNLERIHIFRQKPCLLAKGRNRLQVLLRHIQPSVPHGFPGIFQYVPGQQGIINIFYRLPRIEQPVRIFRIIRQICTCRSRYIGNLDDASCGFRLFFFISFRKPGKRIVLFQHRKAVFIQKTAPLILIG